MVQMIMHDRVKYGTKSCGERAGQLRDRETERQRDRETERQRDRETERQRESIAENERWRGK
jgi:hypothetical protein